MIEKLNNTSFIYSVMQLFYKYCDDRVFKSILENITKNVLNQILFNISVDDLKKLLLRREQYENLKRKEKYNTSDLKKSFQIKIDIEEITNKNVKAFLKNPDETITNTIFILF